MKGRTLAAASMPDRPPWLASTRRPSCRTASRPCLAAALLLAALWAEAPPAGTESLKETIDLALANDASIRSAQAGVEAARLDAASTARANLPRLAAGATYQYTSAVPEVTLSIPPMPDRAISMGQQNNIDLQAGVRWTPFTGFAQAAGVEQKRLQAALAENSLESSQTQVALQAITAFRQAQAARLQIDIITSARQRAQLQIDQAEALEREGMAQKVDVLSLTIGRLDYDQQLIAARASLANALEQLKSFTGKDITVPPPSAPSVREPQASAKQGREAALQEGIAADGRAGAGEAGPRSTLPPLAAEDLGPIKALAIQGRIIETNRKLAESRLYPTLSLSGAIHYGIPGVNPAENEWMLYGAAQASLSWSYNWGGDTLAAQAFDRHRARLASDERATRARIELQYNSAVRDYAAMSEALDVLQASLELARERMTIVQVQYGQGLASATDFNDANLALAQAELQYRSQIVSLQLKANQVDALSGADISQWSVAE